jgi:hypothetical protein
MVPANMRRGIRIGCALALALSLPGGAGAADWASELPSAQVVRGTVKGADAGPRLEASFATLCDYVGVRNGGAKVMPARASALLVEYKCHRVSTAAARYFDSAAFRRELLTRFISPASFEIYAASSPIMRGRPPRTDRE